MDLKKLFRIYTEDPKKVGLYNLSVRFYNDLKDGISATTFIYVKLEHSYDVEPDGIRHRDFMELLSALQDCMDFHYLGGYTSIYGINIEGWL